MQTIDDIFFIWTGTKEQLTNYLNKLNKKHNSIKFQYRISQTSITFLDGEVSIQNNKLVTKIYRKNTNRQNFLHIDSDHPKSLKDSIPYCQALRINRSTLHQMTSITIVSKSNRGFSVKVTNHS